MSAIKVSAATAKAAVAFIKAAAGWVNARELCAFLGVNVETAGAALAFAVADGQIERQHKQGGNGGSQLQWRVAPPKPETLPRLFSIDWPGGFVSTFDRVKLPAYEVRAK